MLVGEIFGFLEQLATYEQYSKSRSTSSFFEVAAATAATRHVGTTVMLKS